MTGEVFQSRAVAGAAARLRVLDAGRATERAAWLRAWERWPEREPMAHPDYAALFARPGDRAVAALAETDGGGTILMPLVLRPLAAEPWAGEGGEAWDATTPYGYGGAFAWGGGARAGAAFWAEYGAFCREARVVSTFARLSLFPEQLAGSLLGRVEESAPNVVVPLAGGPEAVRRRYHREVRRRLRRAAREGLTSEIDLAGAGLDAFHELYLQTMERRGADPWYRFPRDFFARLAAALPGQVVLVHAHAGGRVVSSELALLSASHVYSFLGGTDAGAFRAYPNEVVKDATATWAAARGKAAYVLGGGKGRDDGILRHKRAFAPPEGVVPFRTARLVHDEVAYHRLARRRDAAETAAGRRWTPDLSFFPVYRS
jgi:CelD/BcsL family acetyltransferase involved in cellulose biosynthesis